ncbi:twin-arginine translocase TatA/TatE family subunit [Paenibacillus larvae]|nr:twin-arginine translocase TatA/TatE family subunit [Paenibacillus larvae]
MTLNIGFSEVILLIIVGLLLFGPKKLPELGRAFGKTLKEFKDATRGLVDDPNTGPKDTSAISPSQKNEGESESVENPAEKPADTRRLPD